MDGDFISMPTSLTNTSDLVPHSIPILLADIGCCLHSVSTYIINSVSSCPLPAKSLIAVIYKECSYSRLAIS